VSKIEVFVGMESEEWMVNGIFILSLPILLESTDMTCVFGHYYHLTPAAGHLWRSAFPVWDGLSPIVHRFAGS
jgi:hypothetical protein